MFGGDTIGALILGSEYLIVMVKPKNRFHKTALYINDGVNFCITSVNFHSAEFPLKINSIQFATAELSRIGNFIY